MQDGKLSNTYNIIRRNNFSNFDRILKIYSFMNKLSYIVLLVATMMLCLQTLWINKTYNAYLKETMQDIEQATSESITKEVGMRNYGPHKNPHKPKLFVKEANKMSPEERNSRKGDTLSLTELSKKNIGRNITEVIVQIDQDALIARGKYIKLQKLDSLFYKEVSDKMPIVPKHIILLYDKDTLMMQKAGDTSLLHKKCNVETRLFPIGTKGMQFICVKADVPMSDFIKEMTYILAESIILVLAILGCVIYLVITIRKKNKLFKAREISVNGTVHDLKSPINSMITMLNYLKTKLSEENAKKLVDLSIKQSQDIVSDIDELLITARKDRQKLYLQKKETDIKSLAERAIDTLSVQYKNKNPEINIVRAEERITATVDPFYIGNVIRNLIENALKYSDAGVKIAVNIYEDKNNLFIEVKDAGWGIDKKYQKMIFNRFFRIPPKEDMNSNGYGVGLAYVKFILQAHGGNIKVKSELGKGSSFICKIPK